ncbi:MAG TPA: FecR domain-containing protein [Verrucomicrobiae bacterium]|nr:FecR domain-containing protein [Verrucomicrobiae bacterium]
MKFLPTFAAIAIYAAFTFQSHAQDTKNGIATVVRIQGVARYKLDENDQWHPLVVGKLLHAGAVIQTAKNAYVDVVLGKQVKLPQARPTPDRISLAPDANVRGAVDYTPSAEQNVIRLWENSTIAIDKLTVSDTGADTVSDTELDLKQGRVFANVKKASAASQYLIKIPNGIAGIRGTFFVIDANGMCGVSGKSGHSVVLSVVGPDGTPKTFLINPGYMFDPSTGQMGPLPPDLIALLSQMNTAIETIYYEFTSFSYDWNHRHISPTAGHHRGGGNSGNGRGNGGGNGTGNEGGGQ